MPSLIRSRIGRKLLLAVGLPPFLLALAGILWLQAETHERPALWGTALGYVLLVALAMTAVHFVAVRLLLEQPLSRMVTLLRRAEQGGEFLVRIPVETEDELGQLARGFNTALAAITDLHVRQIEDARSMEAMQRELTLKAELEAQHRLVDEANRRLERRLREVTLLADLSRKFNATLRLDELLHFVTDHVGRTLGYEAFALLLLDAAAGELVVRSVFGIEPAVEGTRLKLGDGVAGFAAQQRQRVLVPDTRVDGRFPAHQWTHGQQGSVLAVPMMFQDACVGVLDFFRPAADAFADEEVSFLEAVAGQAATAIANARLHEETLRLSLTDALTGLHNRRSFLARLEMELERSERFAHTCAVAMIDVDHFRNLNDARGHLAGDATLRRVGELLGGAVRRVDTLARYGGEEFALLLPRADAAAAREVAGKLRAAIEAAAFEHAAAQPGGRVTISVGVAAYPEHARTLAELVDCADAALFAAKRRGRNAVVAHAPGMREDPGRRRDVRTTSVAEPLGPAR